MRRILTACCLSCLVTAQVQGQDGIQRARLDPAKVRVPPFHFQPEYTFDAPSNPQRWALQPKALNVSFASTDQAYFRSEVPDLPQQSQMWEATGWKGERLNAELVVWSPDTVNQIRVAVSDLVNANGATLASRNAQVYLALPNVVALPHIGSASVATRGRMARMAAENLLAALSGQRPPHLVNPEAWQ